MLKRRLIPVLYLKGGYIVRSELFKIHQIMGYPVPHVSRLNEWDVDELIVLDIGTGDYEINRSDHKEKGAASLLELIHMIAVTCAIPLTFGGRIRTVDDIRERIQNGADKVVVNSGFADRPELVTEAAESFGSQAIVVNADYRMVDGEARVFTHHAQKDTGTGVVDWAKRAVDLGAGEIFINAVDRDGTATGYDLDTINKVVAAVEAPVIACGGAGHQSHFGKCFAESGASGVAAGNIFHFTENAYPRAKTYLRERRAAQGDIR
jgi:cyclase